MGYTENDQQQQQEQQPQQGYDQQPQEQQQQQYDNNQQNYQQQGYDQQQQQYNNNQQDYQQQDYDQQQQTQQQPQEYNMDNFMNYLQAQPPPPEKPSGGVCSQCKSDGLQFYDDGRGYCPSCGRQFWWDKERAPKETIAKVEEEQQSGTSSYYGEEYEQQIMDKFVEEQLPQDEDLALLEQMRRVGILYREQRMTWAEFKEKMDELKAEFKD
jgi:uncharacterized Zn finger protein (UPF0148 family)